MPQSQIIGEPKTVFQFQFWLGVASLLAGIAVIAVPLTFSKRLRKRFSQSSIELEHIGLLALVVTVVGIGCYNYFLAGGT